MFFMLSALVQLPARVELDVEAIIDSHAGAVKRYAYLCLKDEKQAEDICQEVFLRLWQNPPRSDDERGLRAWLMKVALNACRDYLRTPWRKRVSATDDERDFARAGSSRSAEGEAQQRESDETLYSAVLNLPIKYREPIILHYYFDYSQKETAQMLAITDSALRSRLMRARTMLREALGEEVEG